VQALYGFGFTGDNTIACSNLCRDEVTATLKHKLDAVFGASFNTNGLGGVLTCGTTGLTAGLSHAPIAAVCALHTSNHDAGQRCNEACWCLYKPDLINTWSNVQGTGKERYVFFSFPHIAIDSTGEVGAISRPGRPGASSACGALKAALGEVQSKGLEANCSQASENNPTSISCGCGAGLLVLSTGWFVAGVSQAC
jgi:Limiting CO2-inducible proteins B/C beta carbonyic anhydrases